MHELDIVEIIPIQIQMHELIQFMHEVCIWNRYGFGVCFEMVKKRYWMSALYIPPLCFVDWKYFPHISFRLIQTSYKSASTSNFCSLLQYKLKIFQLFAAT